MTIIRKDMQLADFAPYVKSFQDSDHWLPEITDEMLNQVVEIVAAYIEEKGTWEDSESKIIVKLNDGRFGTFEEWSDSSGHGCRCGASWRVCDTIEEARGK